MVIPFMVKLSQFNLSLCMPFRPRNNTQVWSWIMVKHSQILNQVVNLDL